LGSVAVSITTMASAGISNPFAIAYLRAATLSMLVADWAGNEEVASSNSAGTKRIIFSPPKS
jgi:hypothetical protein